MVTKFKGLPAVIKKYLLLQESKRRDLEGGGESPDEDDGTQSRDRHSVSLLPKAAPDGCKEEDQLKNNILNEIHLLRQLNLSLLKEKFETG